MNIELIKVNGKDNATISIDGEKHTISFSNLSDVKKGDIIMTDTMAGVKVLKVKEYNTCEPFNGIDYDVFMTCEHYIDDIDYDQRFQFLKPDYKLLILNDYVKSRDTYSDLLEKVKQLENELSKVKQYA